jgi:transcriptional regulator with XRE-family HTH domain
MSDPKSITEQLRESILGCGMSVYEIANRSDCDQSNIHAFLKGKRGLSLGSIERICQVLGLSLKADSGEKGQ